MKSWLKRKIIYIYIDINFYSEAAYIPEEIKLIQLKRKEPNNLKSITEEIFEKYRLFKVYLKDN